MSHFIDIAYNSLNKKGEELCGDKVEIIRTEEDVIVVLSDGLGSGVKANILATLTAKIAGTMLKEGASIEETVHTIVNTLPECNVRKLAYSTFTIIKINKSGSVYIAEYDNPPVLIYRKGINFPLEKHNRILNGKKIVESYFNLKVGDMITIISDGAVHAGVGALLNLGWQWEHINHYLCDINNQHKLAKSITANFIGVCNKLYDHLPGDDTTIVTIKIRDPEIVTLFTGPPEDRDMDKWVINKLVKSDGKKVICGGTTANIAARELKKEINVDLDSFCPEIPPTASIEGFDLVTEGVLTLKATLEKIKSYALDASTDDLMNDGKDGASKLKDLLINDCTHLNLIVGKAVNPAHQNPDIPLNLNIKLHVINELMEHLIHLGKEVKLTLV